MKIEAGREYKTKDHVDGSPTTRGYFKVESVEGGKVRFEVLDVHRASAGGIFAMKEADFVKMIEEGPAT